VGSEMCIRDRDRARNVAVVDRLPILTLQGGDP
jgi:hypothetical protein